MNPWFRMFAREKTRTTWVLLAVTLLEAIPVLLLLLWGSTAEKVIAVIGLVFFGLMLINCSAELLFRSRHPNQRSTGDGA